MMALSIRSPSKHNQMLGTLIKHPKSTNFDGENDRPAKRARLDDDTPDPLSAPSSPRFGNREVPDSEDENQESLEEHSIRQKPDLESALPPVKTDEEAIEEYEAFKASQEQQAETSGERRTDRKSVKGRSSIYVDAFNLALDTVLDEESHLFDDAETGVFRAWRELSYEAQYL
jgi:fanconi-associated nuclease 1